MRPICRRTVLAATAGLCLPRWAKAAEFTLRCGGNLPPDHPLSRSIAAAAQSVAEATSGQVQIECYPDNRLGGDTAMLEQVVAGSLDLMTISGLILSRRVPVAGINGMPFAFSSYGAVWAAMDGVLGAIVRKALEADGLHAEPRMFDNGFRQMTTAHRLIGAPGDLRGLRMRTPNGPIWTSMFDAFGAEPVVIDFAATPAALRDGRVDGQENALTLIDSARLDRVQGRCALTNHMWDGFWLIANKARWDSWPAAVQAAIGRAMEDAALTQRVALRALDDAVQDVLASRGMVFNRPDPAPFKAALTQAGFYQNWQDRFGRDNWVMLETVSGLDG